MQTAHASTQWMPVENFKFSQNVDRYSNQEKAQINSYKHLNRLSNICPRYTEHTERAFHSKRVTMPFTSDLEPRQHLVLNPSRDQHVDEDFSFEELQRELQGLQQQLQEHGRRIFGEDLPALPKSPGAVNIVKSPTPPPIIKEKAIQQTTGQLCLENTQNNASHHSSNSRRPSKNEKYLKEENQKLRRQLAEEREELHRMRALTTVTETKMVSRMTHLEEKLKSLLQNEKKLEKRRLADAEGWRAEFTALRHRLQSTEQRQRKLIALCSIRDEDHRDKVLTRHNKLEKLKQSSSAGNKNRNKTGKSTDAAFGGGRQEREEQIVDADVLHYNKLGQEGLQECMGQLSQELDALKSALSNLEQQFTHK